jgi:hypothetical protein
MVAEIGRARLSGFPGHAMLSCSEMPLYSETSIHDLEATVRVRN